MGICALLVTVERWGQGVNVRAGHAIMGEEEPETEDLWPVSRRFLGREGQTNWFRQDVKNSISDDLGIDIDDMRSL